METVQKEVDGLLVERIGLIATTEEEVVVMMEVIAEVEEEKADVVEVMGEEEADVEVVNKEIVTKFFINTLYHYQLKLCRYYFLCPPFSVQY